MSIFIYNRVHSVKSWADTWYQTCLLSEEKFGDISSFKINGRTRDMFSNDPINLIKPRRLKQSGYVELNYSARDTVINIKELLMYFGVILSEVRIVVLAEIGSQAEMPASPVKTVKKTIISTKPAVSKPALSAFTYDEAEMIYQECMKQFQRKASAASVLSKLSLRIDKPQNKLVMARHQMMHLLSDGKLGLPCTDEVLRKVYNSHKESPGTKSTITEDPDNHKPKSADPIAVSVSSFETGFYDWAKEKYPNQLSDLYFSFSSINYHLKRQGFVDKNIFEVTQPEKAKKLIEMVQRSTLGKNGKFAIALSLYSSYINHHSPKNNTKAPAESENKSSVPMTHQDKKPVVYYLENDLISSIKKCNIRALDERPSGHLWIFGAVIPFVRECKKKGVIFNFDTYFGNNTEFRAKDGWYTDQDFNTAASRTTDSITSRAQITTKSVQSSRANDSEKYLEVIRKDFCRGFTYLAPEKDGTILPETLEKTIYSPRLVSIMLANNEIGTIEPVRELADIAHLHGAYFHTDAVQAVGHIPIDVKQLGVDTLSASGHKFGAPKGVGFLYIRNGVKILPLINGGSQEKGIRGGTENVAAIAAMAAALNNSILSMNNTTLFLNKLTEHFLALLDDSKIKYSINGSTENRLPGHISISFPEKSGEALLHQLDLKGIYVSTGSACDSVRTETSHVLQAIRLPEKLAKGTIRITFGKNNSISDAEAIATALISSLKK